MSRINKNDLSKKKFLHGAFILTFSAIIIKLLSAVYRVPYQNVVGDVGFYIYQQVYPFYAFILVLATYGFPVVISKLLAEVKECKNRYTHSEIVITSWLTLSGISVIMFILLFFSADEIALYMNDPMLMRSLKLISFAFLFMPVISIIKGIFQSKGEMVPTAVAQVIEQFVRVGCILVSCFIFYRYGLSLYKVAEGAFMGSIIGSAISSLILIGYWIKTRQKNLKFDTIKFNNHLIPLMGKILSQGLIFAISSLILVFIQFMDALVLFPLLTDSGLEITSAKQLKGIYDRGQPLIHLGTATTISLSLTIVPLISKFKQQKNLSLVRYYTELSFRLSLMFGAAASVGLFWIIKPVNIMLFTNDEGSGALSILVISILFCSLLMTGMFVLQSLGRSIEALGIIAVGLFIKLLLMQLLIPKFMITGAAISTTVAFILMSVILFVLLRKEFKEPILKKKTILLTIGATIGMTVILCMEGALFEWIRPSVETNRLFSAFEVFISVSSGALVYLFIIIRNGLFSIEELTLLPFGSKLAKLLSKTK